MYAPLVLPEPGMWAVPDLSACEPADDCGYSEDDLYLFGTTLLGRCWGAAYTAGYLRKTERPATCGAFYRRDPVRNSDIYGHSGIALSEVTFPVVKVEEVLVNGVSICPSLWQVENPNLIRRVHSLYEKTHSCRDWSYPAQQNNSLEPRWTASDTSVDDATTMSITANSDGTWTIGLPGVTTVPTSGDAVVLQNGADTWVLPFDGLDMSDPDTWIFTPQVIATTSSFPYTVNEYLLNEQAWTLLRWSGFPTGWPAAAPPDVTTVTVSSRSYVSNPYHEGMSMQVTYRYGAVPPEGPVVLRLFVCELLKVLCPPAESTACTLPKGIVRSVSRNGLNLQMDDETSKQAIFGWNPVVDAAIRNRTAKFPVGIWAPSIRDKARVTTRRGW